MLKNYLKVAWRNLLRNRTYSIINISGLALGMAASLLIILWVRDEKGIDAFHVNGKNLYNVYERSYRNGKVDANIYTRCMLADELRRTIPEVRHASMLEWNQLSTFQAGEKPGKMSGAFAGEDFFKMFSYPLLQGDIRSALTTPDGVVISRKMAAFFFGSPEQAINKTIRFEDKKDLKVTAVFEDLPVSSSQQFEWLGSWKGFVEDNQWALRWGNADPVAYVQLKEGADPAKVALKIKDFLYNYIPRDNGNRVELDLQPYPERYLHSTAKDGRYVAGRIEYVRLFSLVAVIILLIACINFMNLATARSTQRSREVGIRKVVGAIKSALVWQFIGEALLLTAIAVVIALILVGISLPAFNQLTGKRLTVPLDVPAFWGVLAGLLLLTGLVSGSYPALYLSSLNPIRVLKGALRTGRAAIFFRKGLVVVQFALSIVLIVGVIVVYRQLNYIQTQNLGFDRENLASIPLEGELLKNYALLRERAARIPGVLSVSRMTEAPTGIGHHVNDISWAGKPADQVDFFANAVVGYGFVNTMHLQLLEGREFSPSYPTDSNALLINETALRLTGFKSPIGQSLLWGGRRGTIIGVIKDFHFRSMHQAIEPLVVRLDENYRFGNAIVRVQAGHTRETLAGLQALCKQLNPKFPFTYQFADQEYDKIYRSEEVVSRLTAFFAFLAIFISCLGLFGLAAFTAAQRTREIGVRKVLGASVPDIIRLLSGNFLQPVALALLISLPIAWYAANSWLQDFAYKTALDWWIFGLAGLLAIGIAVLTISLQSIRAAIANPVKSLRTE